MIQASSNEVVVKNINEVGGGNLGTSNYIDLKNKPKINGVELNGNKTSADLGIQQLTVDTLLSETSTNPIQNKVITEKVNAVQTSIPTKVSQLINDSGYAIEHNLISTFVLQQNGKGLSSEDFTRALKAKLESLNNYDDTDIQAAVTALQTELDTLVSGNASTAIESFNEIVKFLENIKDTDSLDSIIAGIQASIPTKTSQLSNDSGFITASALPTVEAKLSSSSTNPVQSKVISDYILIQTNIINDRISNECATNTSVDEKIAAAIGTSSAIISEINTLIGG